MGGGIRITPMGLSGLLLDAAGESFSEDVQARIHAVAAALAGREGLYEIVPGMNNLLIQADPDRLPPDAARILLGELWETVDPTPRPGKTVEIPVTYDGEDLSDWAAHAGMTVAEAIDRHAVARYTVAAIGAMPGFAYLSGLDPALAIPRRKVPRAVVPKGAVIVGGAQAAVMPITAPSGWHIIGATDVSLFDPAGDPPCLLAPGDIVRFVPVTVRS